MADSAYNIPYIRIDLNATTSARVIRTATEKARIRAIRINGDADGTTAGDIVLRHTSASGTIVFDLPAPAGSFHDGTINFEPSIPHRGLFMDAVTQTWASGSHMLIYLVE
jgi:hypothetical protein